MSEKKIKLTDDEQKYIYLDRGVVKFLPKVGLNELKLLIYAKSEKEFSKKAAAEFLNMSVEDVEEALAFWCGAEIIKIDESTKAKRTAPTDLYQHYDADFIARQIETDNSYKSLCSFVGDKLEKVLNKNDCNSLYYLYDYVGESAEYIMMLTEYCVQCGKRSMQYIMKTALGKFDDGVDTYEKLEIWIKQKRETDGKAKKLARVCGWGDRELTPKEKEYIRLWFEENDLPFDTVRLAYEKTVDSLGKVSLPYMNKIIDGWLKKGFKTVDEIKEGAQSRPITQRGNEGESFNADDFFNAAVKKGRKNNG